jgi:uncharacterized protein (DUF433 family)
MSKVVSMRFKDDQYARLQRAARSLDRTPSETAALFVEEALREREFAFIEFRETVVGRQAYIDGSRLPVWQVVWIARDYDGDIAKTAEHLGLPPIQIKAALNYAADFREEIDAAIADNDVSYEELRRRLPNLELLPIRDAATP